MKTINNILETMTKFINDGHSFGYAKYKAFSEFKINHRNKEKAIVEDEEYINLKMTYLTQHRKEKRWVK